MPAMPSSTVPGRFGIERTTGTPGAICRSIADVGIAAATERTVCSGVRMPPISPSNASKSWGFTAITTSAAPATASAFESVTRMPWRSASSWARSSSRTVATISPGSRQPPLSRPRSSDSPIVPAPMIATRRASTAMAESLGGVRVRQCDQPGAVGVEQVHARETGPLAVGLEQLGRLPTLDPTATQRGAELHEPEVGDEPAVVAAEALQEDDPYRPRPEPALSQQPVGGGIAWPVAQPLQLDRAADADERGAAAHAEAQPPQLGGRESAKRLAPGRCVQPSASQRWCQRADDRALDRPCAAGLDQLSADGPQERLGDGRRAHRPQAADAPRRLADQRVAREATQELRMVVIDGEHKPQLVDAGVAGRAQLHRAVGLLPGAAGAAARERGDEDAVDDRAGRIAAAPGRRAQGVRAARPDRGGDHCNCSRSAPGTDQSCLPLPAGTTRYRRAVSIDPRVDIGHVHLKVADIDRSLAFYRDILGFDVPQRLDDQAAFISAGGYHHHLALNTWESRGGSPPPPGTTGPYHRAAPSPDPAPPRLPPGAIRYPDRAQLADALRRLVEAKWPVDGATDHGVSEAIYLRDPDGNGVELYRDRPEDEWPRPADGEGVAMRNAPFDLQALLAEAG